MIMIVRKPNAIPRGDRNTPITLYNFKYAVGSCEFLVQNYLSIKAK